jgi:sec-independent protein translocase protein TatC
MNNMEDEKLPLTSHLEELRKRLIRILIAVGIGFFACYYFKEYLFKIITQPLVQVLPKNSHMIFTGLPEAFFIYMKIAFFASLFLTSPYIFYQVWRFIAPGLYPGEKRHVIPFVLSSTFLFIAGILFGYYIALPPAFEFFVAFSSDFLKPMISENASGLRRFL